MKSPRALKAPFFFFLPLLLKDIENAKIEFLTNIGKKITLKRGAIMTKKPKDISGKQLLQKTYKVSVKDIIVH